MCLKKSSKVVSIKPASIKTPIWNKSVIRARESFSDLTNSLKEKYSKELNILEKNAISNNSKGICVKKVTDVVIKVINTKNPKPSYNVGFMSCFAELISHLPQGMLNKLIKFKLKHM